MIRGPQAQSPLPLLLLAFLIAVALKIAVHEQDQLSERVIDATISYSSPGPDTIVYDRRETVKVAVRGPASDMSRLAPFAVEVQTAIPRGRSGPREILLGPDDVRFAVPGDFEVLSIEPNRFSIQVEERLVRSVPVRVELYGEPAAGARPGTPTARPSSARISGPRSKIERVTEVVTRISLDGHARDFDEAASLTPPDPLITIEQPTLVTVTVPMEEPELSISFEDLQPDAGAPVNDDPPGIGGP